MEYLGLKEDGLYAVAADEEIFIKYYEKNWVEIIADTYYQTEQLDIGHKFRPRLVYWGYMAGKTSSMSEDDYDAVARVAVCIELVHKASIILDDYIDGDTARHGRASFHIIHGPERTMIYSLNILCRALRIINQVFYTHIQDISAIEKSLKIVISTLEDMSLGVLKELDLSHNMSVQKLSEIQEIMYLETASLITNSLLIGYLLSQNIDNSVFEIFDRIGKDLGYIFQVLNDLEPFCSKVNYDHKGSLNTDISRNRKNICVPLLYIHLNNQEKKVIENTASENLDTVLLKFFEKYNVKQQLLEEVYHMRSRIHDNIRIMSQYSPNSKWYELFHEFIDSVINISSNRLQ